MFQFDKNKYNYHLNGIEHEIILSDNNKKARQSYNKKLLLVYPMSQFVIKRDMYAVNYNALIP